MWGSTKKSLLRTRKSIRSPISLTILFKILRTTIILTSKDAGISVRSEGNAWESTHVKHRIPIGRIKNV